MKEILKELRKKNSYSQEQISQKIGISRQSYYKYEKGTVNPPIEIIQKLTNIYNVEPSIFFTNTIQTSDFSYKNTEEITLSVSSPAVKYSTQLQGNSFEAIYNGTSLLLLNKASFPFEKGQKVTIYINSPNKVESDKQKNEENFFSQHIAIPNSQKIKEESKQYLLNFINNAKPHNDYNYKKEISNILRERYENSN